MIKNTFEEQILMGRLPSSPGVGRLVVELVREKQLSAKQLEDVVRLDPALTGRLLQASNSLVPSGQALIETLPAAIDILGQSAHPRALRNLTLVTPGNSKWCAGFDYDRYWGVAIARAASAEAIVRATGRANPEAAYTIGLLADVGRLALASVYPGEYSNLLVDSHSFGNEELCRRERARFRINHSEVSACLLEHWGIPKTSTQAILLYESKEEEEKTIEARVLDLASVLRCASLAAECHFDAAKGLETDRAHVLLQELRTELRLSEDSARMVRSEIQRTIAERGVLTTVAAEKEETKREEVESEEPPRRVNPSAPPGPERSLRILAVDDDPTSLQILRRTLLQAGHEVVTASNGADALQVALERNPEAIVADWMMPRMDGVELCRALRCIQSGQQMYFLLLTGRDQEDQIVAAYDAGVDDYVTKPFNPRILLARLRPGQRMSELRRNLDAERQFSEERLKEISTAKRMFETASKTDPLTSLPNRRHACDRLAEEWQSSMRGSTSLAVMMIDVDRFKRINDEHGHEVGDIVLIEIAQILRSHGRQGEEVARIGGEEFLVICPNTNTQQAATGAERLRKAVESHVIHTPGKEIRTTVSIGVAERTPAMQSLDALLKAADEAVYAAKSAERNQVQIAKSSPMSSPMNPPGRALSA
jgi:two-component system, cell cycle response regulator